MDKMPSKAKLKTFNARRPVRVKVILVRSPAAKRDPPTRAPVILRIGVATLRTPPVRQEHPFFILSIEEEDPAEGGGAVSLEGEEGEGGPLTWDVGLIGGVVILFPVLKSVF